MSERPEFHPAANLFPLLPEVELAALAKDIRENGQEIPIVMYDGKILDGRNRWIACERAGVTPKTSDWIPKDGQSPVMWVISLNLHRRHLDASQRAMAAADALPMLEEEAKARQLSTLKQFSEDRSGKNSHTVVSLPAGPEIVTPTFDEEQARKQRQIEEEQRRTAAKRNEEGLRLQRDMEEKRAARAREEAAQAFKVNDRYVQDAKALKQTAPDVAVAVKNGVVKLQDAKQIAKLPEPSRIEVLQQVQSGSSVKQAIAHEIKKEVIQSQREETSEGRAPTAYWLYHSQKPDVSRLTSNAVFFVLVSPSQTANAIDVIREMGLKYESNFVITKADKTHRLLLAFTRGNSMAPTLDVGSTIITSGPYDAIQRMCEGPYLDLSDGNARGWLK